MSNPIQRCIIHAQIFRPDGICQNIHIGFQEIHLVLDFNIYRAVHHISNVAGPAAHIRSCLNNLRCHALYRCIVGNIQCTEHMPQINQVSVGKRELLKILQR